MARDAKEAKQTFEQLYGQLEEAVGKLEAGGLPLEDAIALYEQGMELARRCQERLDNAELKITKLRESFAPLPDRPANGRAVNDADDVSDYEYVAEEEESRSGDDDPFD